MPNLKYVLPNLRPTVFVPHIYSAQILVYSPERATRRRRQIGDLLDPRFKGKIGFPRQNFFLAMMGAGLFESGNQDDFDKAKDFMVKLSDNGLRLYPADRCNGAGLQVRRNRRRHHVAGAHRICGRTPASR